MKYPNIIVLILDAVRARNLSAYGYPERTTPHIDAFAQRHLLFERAFTTSTWTIPTHKSLLSGLYLSQHGINSMDANVIFNEHVVPLPEALREIGYFTAGFSQNLLFSPHFRFDSFDEFHTPKTLNGKPAVVDTARTPPADRSPLGSLRRYAHKTSSLASYVRFMEEWITARPLRTPFFLVANISHVHAPWAPAPVILLKKLKGLVPLLFNPDFSSPRPFDFNSRKKSVTDRHRQVWTRLYDAALIHTDLEIGRFLDRLERWPGWPDTIFILTADHGEVLGDHNDIVGHTLTLNDRIMHVPLILKHPDYRRYGRVQGVVQTIDLYSSILRWNNFSGVPAAQLRRPSLDSAISSPEAVDGIAIAEEDYTGDYDVISGLLKVHPKMDPDLYPRRQTAFRNAKYKLMEYDVWPATLFDLQTDPVEAFGFTTARPDGCLATIQAMEAELKRWRADLEIFPPRGTRPHTALITQRLRDLGYLP